MAHNPFLSMEDNVMVPVQSDVLNPFMMGDVEECDLNADNPFAASNPFSDFGSSFSEASTDNHVPDIFSSNSPFTTAAMPEEFPKQSSAESFLTSTAELEAKPAIQMIKPSELDLSSGLQGHSPFGSEENLNKPKRPPPPRPLPPETQDLILSVTDHMDFTSSHLLDRIPPTRTPSPVSMRDLHSPTPDYPFAESGNELDQNLIDTGIDNSFVPSSQTDKAQDLFGTSEELTPVVTNTANPPVANHTDLFDINQNKPSRPVPPARPQGPPPRPQPPQPPAPPSKPVEPKPPVSQHDDDINLFDAPMQTTQVKPTNEAILSLYSLPKKEEKPIDFLSDDILDAEEPGETNKENIMPESITQVVDLKEEHQTSPPQVMPSPFVSSPEEIAQVPVSVVGTDSKRESAANIFTSEPVAENLPEEEAKNPFESMETDEYCAQEPVASQPFTDPFSEPMDTTNYPETNSVFEMDSVPENVFGDPAPANLGFPESADAFDAFSAKFDSTINTEERNGSAWGAQPDSWGAAPSGDGFEGDGSFDAFLTLAEAPPAPAATPAPFSKEDSQESDDGNFNVFIKPKNNESGSDATSAETVGVPALAPPPRPQALPESPRLNPFDKGAGFPDAVYAEPVVGDEDAEKKSGSETPPTPLFDDDVSVPLEDFPRVKYEGNGWEMQLRQPNKKKITGQRFWKKIFVKLIYQGDNPVVQLFNSPTDKEPFQELPLQACYSVSEIGAQQYDQFGKIFTVKLQYVFYKERPGVRPGQVTKAERITNKLSQFAAYAIQGDYQGVKEFGSDLKKLGLPVEHAPQISQLFKIGSLSFEDMKQFSVCVEEALFKLNAHRDRALVYKMEEVQITAVDELYVEQDAEGSVMKQIARVRLFFLGFLTGMPDVELGVNDMRRQGKEVVGRHDIIPVVTEEWIRLEVVEFHACVQPEEFHNTKIIKFKPPDACYIELMRFRIRPPKNRELPLQLKAVMCVTGNKVELRADVLVPGFASRKLGQVPCEDVMIRFPIPECWIYLFRVEKHFRYGSVKSAHRRTGKIKGIERFLGAVDTLQESLIEVTSGQAKYEHQHRAIVWRMPRLPKEGQGAYTTHNLVCRMALTSYDQIPAELAQWAYVEFTMPATQVSHMTVRSVSLQNHDSDEPPEKYVRYLARHEYKVGIEHTTGSTTAAYVAAASVPTQPAPAPQPSPVAQQVSSDSDSD